MKKNKKNVRGITLIALVVTIVVLLILAVVSISMLTGENGIIKQAQEAKENTKIGEEKEIVKLAAIGARENGYGEITKDRLQKELDELTKGNANVTGNGPFKVTYVDSKRRYEVDAYGNISELGIVEGVEKLAELKAKETPVEGNTTLEDENGDNITIPDGFNIDKDSPITVIEGIVIEDSYENQYVWIPVFEESDERDWGADYSYVSTSKTAERSSFTEADYSEIEAALKIYTESYASDSNADEWYGNATYGTWGYYNGTEFVYYTNGNMSESAYNELYQNMLVSVYKNGGFYIGRYEMGIGVATSVETAESLARTEMTEYAALEATKDNTSTTVVENGAPSIQGMPTPIVKANAVGYNHITQCQAQMLAKKMGQEYNYGNTTSSLMFGVQWDAVCVFLEYANEIHWNYGDYLFQMDRGYYNIVEYDGSLTGWNNASEKLSSGAWLCTTGASDTNSALNIYDFGGNFWELTLEGSGLAGAPVVGRGSNFESTWDEDHYSRNPHSQFKGSTYASARPTLWL